MAPLPNLGPESFGESDSGDLIGPKSVEILYEGYYYDVTDFMGRHPGGNVIKFYTEEGEDATAAVQQFHHRSMNKVNLILKSFKRRPATDRDLKMDSSKLERHRELSLDYTKLYLELQKEGLFNASYIHLTWRLFQWVSLCSVGLALQGTDFYLLGVFVLAMGVGQAGWLMHEGGHNSLTGIPKLDKFIESACLGISFGIPGGWWTRMHNKHHAMPQRLHHDVDLDTTPLIAFNAKVIKNSKEGRTFFIQNQTWLLLSVDLFLVLASWRLYLGPKNVFKTLNYLDMSMMAIHWYIVYSYLSLPLQILTLWLVANHLFGNFTLSHSHLPVTEESTHWIEYGLNHTSDIESNWLVDWWMGYLNFQIEHHLFPTMPQFRNYRVAERVKALAAKHGLKYNVYSYWEAYRITIDNLRNVANELKSED